MILTNLYCVLGVAKYRGDWGWEKQKRASELVLIYSSSSWAKYRFYTMVTHRLLFWLVASIPTCMCLLCIAARGCALRPFYCFPFPCDCWMMNRSGDLVCLCLFCCLFLFVVGAYKRWVALRGCSSLLSSPIIDFTIKQSCLPLPILPSRFRTRRTPVPRMLWNRWSR